MDHLDLGVRVVSPWRWVLVQTRQGLQALLPAWTGDLRETRWQASQPMHTQQTHNKGSKQAKVRENRLVPSTAAVAVVGGVHCSWPRRLELASRPHEALPEAARSQAEDPAHPHPVMWSHVCQQTPCCLCLKAALSYSTWAILSWLTAVRSAAAAAARNAVILCPGT